MTTNVIINAHVAPDKQVSVAVYDHKADKLVEELLLQNGETAERTIYDHLEISVMEIEK